MKMHSVIHFRALIIGALMLLLASIVALGRYGFSHPALIDFTETMHKFIGTFVYTFISLGIYILLIEPLFARRQSRSECAKRYQELQWWCTNNTLGNENYSEYQRYAKAFDQAVANHLRNHPNDEGVEWLQRFRWQAEAALVREP